MKVFIALLIALSSLSSFGASWLVLSKQQQRQIKNDACARAALNAVVKMVDEEIQNGFIPKPKSKLALLELRKVTLKSKYVVTLEEDVPMTVETKSVGRGCIAGEPARLMNF